MTLGDRQIEMTNENFLRMQGIEKVADIFRDPSRQRLLTAAVMARAISNQEVYELLLETAYAAFPLRPKGGPDAPDHPGDQRPADS